MLLPLLLTTAYLAAQQKQQVGAHIRYRRGRWWYRMSCSVRFFGSLFFGRFMSLRALIRFIHLWEPCVYIYLNLVKINCFLDIFQHNFIKIQSSNAPSCSEFWTGFFINVFCAYNKSYFFFKGKGKFSKCFFYRRLSTEPKACFKKK